MYFKSYAPTDHLSDFVKEYWIVENHIPDISKQKIIPDGFFEIIFHYGSPYRINLHGEWETQANKLFAGQINRHFYLENTGITGMIGIKLHPVSAYPLFGKSMESFLNKVVDLQQITTYYPEELNRVNDPELPGIGKIKILESWLSNRLQQPLKHKLERLHKAINMIFDCKGVIGVDNLAKSVYVSRRQLEREFKKVIGLSPKLYCRIIRFKHIFEIMQKGDDSWVNIAVESGHFDQAHFIRNFKEFTGEEPTNYGFDETNMANFFLYD